MNFNISEKTIKRRKEKRKKRQDKKNGMNILSPKGKLYYCLKAFINNSYKIIKKHRPILLISEPDHVTFLQEGLPKTLTEKKSEPSWRKKKYL